MNILTIEQQYLIALELDYQLQKINQFMAKQKYINSARIIQRQFGRFRKQKLIAKANLIVKYAKDFLKRKQQKALLFQQIIENTLKKNGFNKWKMNNNLGKSFKKFSIQLQYPINAILYIQKFCRRQQYLKQNQHTLIQQLIYYRKEQIAVKNIKKKLQNYQNVYYSDQIIKCKQEIAILKEIEFIENLIEINNVGFEHKWEHYQNQLEKHIEKQSKVSDYLQQQDECNQTYWLNLKTMKKIYYNPNDKLIKQNVIPIYSSSVEEFNQQLKYLYNSKQKLMELLILVKASEIPKFQFDN